jgi:hypothetical protein
MLQLSVGSQLAMDLLVQGEEGPSERTPCWGPYPLGVSGFSTVASGCQRVWPARVCTPGDFWGAT